MRKERLGVPSFLKRKEEYTISKATPIGLRVALSNMATPTCSHQPTDSHLVAAWASGSQTLTVVAATPGGTILPEVDEVHQRLWALDTHKACGVPLFAVASPISIDHRAVSRGSSLAELTDLERIWERGACDVGLNPSSTLSASCVTVNKLKDFSVPWFCHLQSGLNALSIFED